MNDKLGQILLLIIISVILFITFKQLYNTGKHSTEYKDKILYSKTKDLYHNTTIYKFAFTDGTDDEVSYGEYCVYEIGDTIHYVREENQVFWEIVNNKDK